jgi:hypothetical protein
MKQTCFSTDRVKGCNRAGICTKIARHGLNCRADGVADSDV